MFVCYMTSSLGSKLSIRNRKFGVYLSRHYRNALSRMSIGEIKMAKTFEQLVPAPAGRFDGISRPYSPAEVEKLRGSVPIAYTLAEKGANRLWKSLKSEPFVNSLGAVTGNQAMQQARAGLPAIYLSGWQVAGDANTAGQMYPDQSLYPVDAVPNVVRRINNALRRCDQIARSEGGKDGTYWMAPIIADAE